MEDYARFTTDKDDRNGTAGFVLHKGAGSRKPGDCDRGSLRVFEERLASESDGYWSSGSRDAKEKFCKCLIETAKTNGIFIAREDCLKLGERVLIRSGESTIYENAAQGLIYKVRDPFAKIHLKSKNLKNILYEHIVHNLLFPDTKYMLIGISHVEEEVRFVYSQKLIYSLNQPTQQQIDDYLASMGLMPEERYYYCNDYISVTDVDANSDNVLLSDDGRLLFIDPIIKIKKPIDEILKAYPFASDKTSENKNDSLFSIFRKLFRK